MAPKQRAPAGAGVPKNDGLEDLRASCQEFLVRVGTKGVRAAGTGPASQDATLADEKLLEHLTLGWQKQREEDVARYLQAQQGDLRRRKPNQSQGQSQPTREEHAKATCKLFLKSGEHLHVDAEAADSLSNLQPGQAASALARLRVLSPECGTLVAEEGDYVKIYETVCPGDVVALWGPALLVSGPATEKSKVKLKPATMEEFPLMQLLRLYAIAGPGQRRKAQRYVGKFLGLPPSQQFPWYIYGLPLEDLRQMPNNKWSVELPVQRDERPRCIALGGDCDEVREAFDPELIRRFLQLVGAERLTEEEKAAGACRDNALVVGRSGTGKTTVAMLRLAALEILCPDPATGPRSIFMTASPVLSREVLRSFTVMRRLPELRAVLKEAGLLRTEGTREAGGEIGTAAADVSSRCDAASAPSCEPLTSGVPSAHPGAPSQAPSQAQRLPHTHSTASLGSWFALHSSATLDSFQMVDAQEVYDLATEVDESEEVQSQAQGPLDETEDGAAEEATTALGDGADSSDGEAVGWAPLPGPRLPPALTAADAKDFPMFVTVRQFLHMLDATLARPFFARDANLRPVETDICTWQPEGGGAQLVNEWLGGSKWQPDADGAGADAGQVEAEGDHTADDLLNAAAGVRTHGQAGAAGPSQRREVSYEYFVDAFWPNLPKAGSCKFHPSLVWTEFMANIKGSPEAFAQGGALTAEQYAGDFGRKRVPMTDDQRASVYNLYKEYERLKERVFAFDEADFVQHLARHLRAQGYVGPRIGCLLIDEVQDLSQATLRLLLDVVDAQRGGLFFCGDAAQTISKGLAFRLCDLRSAFLEGPRSGTHAAPCVQRLTKNFRSAEPVLNLANRVLGLLKSLFPDALDHGGEESAVASGHGHSSTPTRAPLPQRAQSIEALLAAVSTGGAAGERPAFGADLVVIVREQARKAALPPLLQHCLVMTVWEAKGLEFDTVVLLDFFRDAQADWAVVGQIGSHGQISTSPSSWSPESHALLCCELKQLYVAITRAKRRVLFFDEQPCTVTSLQWAGPLVEELHGGQPGTNEETSTSATSPDAWRAQGRRLLRMGFAAQAELCFSWSGDVTLQQEAQATQLAKTAAASRAQGEVGRALQQQRSEGQGQEKEKEDEQEEATQQFLRAAELFDGCGRPVHAAKCLAAAGRWDEAAGRFQASGRWGEAATAFLRAGTNEAAAECFERGAQWPRALAAWRRAGNNTQLLRCAQRALAQGSAVETREACLLQVHSALSELEGQEAVREAAMLLGAPASSDDTALATFLAREIGAESAALQLLREEDPQREALQLRAFYRSVQQERPKWTLLPADLGFSWPSLVSLLFGLLPEGVLENPQGPSQPPPAARISALTPASSPELRASVLQVLLPSKQKAGPSDSAVELAAAKALVSADMMSADVLRLGAGLQPLSLASLPCVAFPTSALSCKIPCLTLRDTWRVAPEKQVLAAALQEVAGTAAHVLARHLDAGASQVDLLQALRTLQGAPPETFQRLAERYAQARWSEAGFVAKAGKLGTVASPSLQRALLGAALDSWKAGGEKRVSATNVERTFVTLLAGGAELLELLYEFRGAQGHAPLVSFVTHLLAGDLASAARSLAAYLESSEELPLNFAVTLVSYLAGPCTVVLQARQGAYVLSGLVWDWSPRLLQGESLAKELWRVREALLWRAAREPAAAARKPKAKDGKPKAKAKQAAALNMDDFDEPTHNDAEDQRDVRFGGPLHEQVDAQLRYACGQELEDSWWEAAWSDDLQQAPLGKAEGSSLRSALATQQQQACAVRTRRREAGRRLSAWAGRCLRSRQEVSLWQAILQASTTLRLTKLAPTADVEAVLRVVGQALQGAGVRVAEVRRATRALEVGERQRQAREKGLKQQLEVERTREKRQLLREAQRQRGLRRQDRLEKKAELLRKARRG